MEEIWSSYTVNINTCNQLKIHHQNILFKNKSLPMWEHLENHVFTIVWFAQLIPLSMLISYLLQQNIPKYFTSIFISQNFLTMITIRPNKRQKNKNKFSPEFAESSHLKWKVLPSPTFHLVDLRALTNIWGRYGSKSSIYCYNFAIYNPNRSHDSLN